MLVLPFLGIALGLTSRPRRPRIGLAGFVLLILYHFLLQFAQGLANDGGAPPWLAYWLPFALFTCISVWAFHEMVMRPGYNPFMATIDRLVDMPDFFHRLVAPHQHGVSAAMDGSGVDAGSSSTIRREHGRSRTRH